MTESPDITRLLGAAAQGDRAAGERVWAAVYEELRRIAHRELGRDGGADTLSTSGLVHEAYFKLGGGTLAVANRRHFYALACRAMRQVLVDRARRGKADKRGGGAAPASLHRVEPAADDRAFDLVDLDDALTGLGAINERMVRVVECRFFGGLSFPEIAETLAMPRPTGAGERSNAVYVVPLDGSEARLLAHMPFPVNPRDIDITPDGRVLITAKSENLSDAWLIHGFDPFRR